MEDLLAKCAHAGIPVAPASDPAIHAGRARLRHGTVTDEVLAREVTVAAVTAGAHMDERLLPVPRLGRLQRPHRGGDQWRTPLPPWGMRLSRMLRAVRRAVGDADLDLSWADDGHTCRVIAVGRA